MDPPRMRHRDARPLSQPIAAAMRSGFSPVGLAGTYLAPDFMDGPVDQINKHVRLELPYVAGVNFQLGERSDKLCKNLDISHDAATLFTDVWRQMVSRSQALCSASLSR